jgi:hypothetical protein
MPTVGGHAWPVIRDGLEPGYALHSRPIQKSVQPERGVVPGNGFARVSSVEISNNLHLSLLQLAFSRRLNNLPNART